jgi:hypothetical protein
LLGESYAFARTAYAKFALISGIPSYPEEIAQLSAICHDKIVLGFEEAQVAEDEVHGYQDPLSSRCVSV